MARHGFRLGPTPCRSHASAMPIGVGRHHQTNQSQTKDLTERIADALVQQSSGGARDYARMHFVSAVMHGINGFGLEPFSPFGVALGLLVSLVPLIDLCRCDFGCRLRRAKGRREWSYHIMVGP